MTIEKTLSRRDIDFQLHEVLKVELLCDRERFSEHNRETFDAVLDLAQSLARDEFYPINRVLDVDEPKFDGEKVSTPAALKPAIKAYLESGLLSAGFDYAQGGMQLPSVINRAAHCFISAASVGSTLFGLTPANASTQLKHGSDFHKNVIVPKMLSGEWFGTMCLSEPQAGSSLSDITTKAIPQADGTYRLFGNKMWISGGDEDVSKNVIHLVLAKIPGPDGKPIPGTKGISLFVVPKFLINPDGSLRARNDVAVAGLNHKMGFRGIPNCLMNFGEGKYPVHGQAGAIGTLVGQEHRGLACMFHMMNDARIMVGGAAAAIGYSGYLHALDYARTRVQGRKPQGKDPNAAPLRIIEHADVRRMLMAQKAYAEGAMALVLKCAQLLDDEHTAPEANQAREANLLLELLTPVCKSWPSQWCQEGNSLAIQIHGGYGYTRDFQVEQLWRDQRLNPIHEGTHGIQALDLLGRKILLEKGAAFKLLRSRIEATMSLAKTSPTWAPQGRALAHVLERVEDTVKKLYAAGDLDVSLANATAFLEAFGHMILAWIWLEQGVVASEKLGAIAGAGKSADEDFYRGKIQTAEWFFVWELPRTHAWLDGLDSLDTTSLRMQEAWF